MNTKIDTYIGFAIKKGSVVFGIDSIIKYRKKMYLLLYVDGLANNSLQQLQLVASQRNLPLLKIASNSTLDSKNCKALAICDNSLAGAIIDNLK